jgi:hypothetical protein
MSLPVEFSTDITKEHYNNHYWEFIFWEPNVHPATCEIPLMTEEMLL